jgi:hypothetical protein
VGWGKGLQPRTVTVRKWITLLPADAKLHMTTLYFCPVEAFRWSRTLSRQAFNVSITSQKKPSVTGRRYSCLLAGSDAPGCYLHVDRHDVSVWEGMLKPPSENGNRQGHSPRPARRLRRGGDQPLIRKWAFVAQCWWEAGRTEIFA